MKKFILTLIIILAFALRFYQLNSYPALNADEAALGYNAYSLLETGKDEHGNPWPIHFQSFNDFKPGLYVYLIMPFVAFFGMNEWTVRIPGAFLGVMTVVTVYFLVKELFKNNEKIRREEFALFASFILAISPWHIHFSRGGWEVNVATFFITAGVLFFYKGLRNQTHLLVSVLLFVMALYTYHAARIIVPLLGIGLITIHWKTIWNQKKRIILVGLLGVVLLIPLLIDLLGPAGVSRAAGVGLFADPGPRNRINELRGEHADYQSESSVIFHNKAVNYGIAFLQNWAEHFDGEFLFLSGDIIERNRVPETGQTYMISIVLLAIAVFAIAKNTKGWAILLWWLAIAPLAAALTFQSPHALRAQNMVIPFEIINAFGLFTLYQYIKDTKWKRAYKYVGLGFISLILFVSLGRYLHMYYVHMAKEYPYSSQYGVKELVHYVNSRQNEFQKVLVTDRYDQPYIMFLFYMKYPPKDFQENHELSPRDQFGFSTVRSFDKYNFWPIDITAAKRDYPNSLIAGADKEIPNESNIVQRIYGTNGFLYFEVVAN